MVMVGGAMEGGTRESGEIRKSREEGETAVGRGLVYSNAWQDLKI